MVDWLIQLNLQHHILVYVVVIIMACLEGPILSMIGGVLIRLGVFPLLPLLVALMLGDLVGDILWYYIGRKWGHAFIARFGKYFNITEKAVTKVTKIFHKYKHPILFVSKISNGFGFALATLMVAGMVRVPFWLFISINMIGQFFWSGVLISIGYFFGNLYLTVNSVLEKGAVVTGFICVFVALWGYKNYLSKKAATITIE